MTFRAEIVITLKEGVFGHGGKGGFPLPAPSGASRDTGTSHGPGW